MAEPPKLIIDSDWKSQAQAEKEKLAAQERERAAAKQAQGPMGGLPGMGGHPGEGGHPDERMPEASFEELIRMFVLPTLTYLGAFPDPETGRSIVALDVAKLHIDLLALLETKTKGNLTEQETTALTRVLHELRLQFVEVSKAVAKAMQEGRVARSGPGAGPPGSGGVIPASGPLPPSPPASSPLPNLRFPST